VRELKIEKPKDGGRNIRRGEEKKVRSFFSFKVRLQWVQSVAVYVQERKQKRNPQSLAAGFKHAKPTHHSSCRGHGRLSGTGLFSCSFWQSHQANATSTTMSDDLFTHFLGNGTRETIAMQEKTAIIAKLATRRVDN
jgi:hypothetical protein